MKGTRARYCLSAAAAAGCASGLLAQPCPQAWSPVGEFPGDAATVASLAAFDFGQGPQLVAGGDFGSFGGMHIARWDGVQWHLFGRFQRYPGNITSILIADLGGGPRLFAAQVTREWIWVTDTSVHSWNGSAWDLVAANCSGGPVPSGPVGQINALATFDDGTGPALFAAGAIVCIAGAPPTSTNVTVSHIAKWEGQSWSDVGGGVTPVPNSPAIPILALEVFNDGTGPALYAGGSFTHAGGVPADAIARWDGQSWSALGSGIQGPLGQLPRRVAGMAIFDDGSGPALYVAGSFTHAGGIPAQNIARWSATGWAAVGDLTLTSPAQSARPLGVYDDGNGPALYVGGQILFADGTPVMNIARFDGAQWSSVGAGAIGMFAGGAPAAMFAFDDGTGPAAYFGGQFTSIGGIEAHGIVRWSGCPCPANCDGSTIAPVLTVDDFTCFINEFAHATTLPSPGQLTHWVNCDHSRTAPILSVDDFTCFINRFAAGCPSP